MAREVVFLVFSWCLMTVLLRGVVGWSAVCDCGNFWSYSLTFYMIDNCAASHLGHPCMLMSQLLMLAFYINCVALLLCICFTCWGRADLLALLYMVFYCVFVTFPCGVLGRVWCLILSIPEISSLLILI